MFFFCWGGGWEGIKNWDALGGFGMHFGSLFSSAKDGRIQEMDYIWICSCRWELRHPIQPLKYVDPISLEAKELGLPQPKLLEGERKLRAMPDAGDNLHFRTTCS